MINEKDRLIDKSIEAFLLALEVYNKPTIKYRVEGFSFFITNAWELLLKAEMLNRGFSIYYKDNPSRTISIDVAIRKVYPDKNTRIRLNLEKIVELRNISTHYITEDYEQKYIPLFQACVLNYVNELYRFHRRDISDYISNNFMTIAANYEPLDNEQIRLKYSPEIAEKFIQQANEIDILTKTYDSEKFSINIKQNLYITKKKDNSDFCVSIEKNSPNPVAIVKELKDPSKTHPYSYNTVITVIQEKTKRENIHLGYAKGFNSFVLNLVMDFYNVKSEEKYAYKHTIGTQEHYTYSQSFVDFIISEIKKNPEEFVDSLKQIKKITPGT